MKKVIMFAIISLFMLSTVVLSYAEDIVINGTQIKGSPGRDAQIISKTVKLSIPATITKIEGAPEGLCIQSPAEQPLCGEAKELIGKKLKPGSYTAYPNIPERKDRQSVTIYLK